MMAAYPPDLACIHDVGFSHIARNAALWVVDELKQLNIERGTITESGCGRGITSRLFVDAGFRVVGIDVAEPFMEIARVRVPEGTFYVDSFVTANIPMSVAITGIGEVFNYTFDQRNTPKIRAELFQRSSSALEPGGPINFDMAGPDRIMTATPQRT